MAYKAQPSSQQEWMRAIEDYEDGICKSAKRGRRRLPFLVTLIRVISATRILFKQFFTTFVASTRMLKLPVSAPALRLPFEPVKSKQFQLLRGSLNPGSPRNPLAWICREGAGLSE